jgi:diguanylate cyclase (GGDEF)-like protein/PAS domain S-box-containing protein
MAVVDNIDFQALAENSADIICSTGMDGLLRYVSPASLEILGWKPEEMVGKTLYDFAFAEDVPVLTGAFVTQDKNATFRMRKKDGSQAWIESHIRVAPNSAGGEPKEFIFVMRDITNYKMLEEKVSALTLIDGPTGLSNPRAFESALDMEWKRTLRGRSDISLLLLDIVRLKGADREDQQEERDDWVRAVATAVGGAVRATDFVARYSGAEIAIILPAADIAGAVRVAEKIRSAVESLEPPDGEKQEDGWLIANIGVATALARHGESMNMPETLLLAADHALQEAKLKGQTCCAWQVGLVHFGGLIWSNAEQAAASGETATDSRPMTTV